MSSGIQNCMPMRIASSSTSIGLERCIFGWVPEETTFPQLSRRTKPTPERWWSGKMTPSTFNFQLSDSSGHHWSLIELGLCALLQTSRESAHREMTWFTISDEVMLLCSKIKEFLRFHIPHAIRIISLNRSRQFCVHGKRLSKGTLVGCGFKICSWNFCHTFATFGHSNVA